MVFSLILPVFGVQFSLITTGFPPTHHDEYIAAKDRETSGTAKQDQRRNARASEEKK
jgi:hypothetical protein